MAIDATNLALVQAEFGDSSAFTPDQIGDYWDMMSGASSDYERRRATVGFMFTIARNNAARLRDYSAGDSSEKASQVYNQLAKLVAEYQSSIDAALGTKSQIARNVLRPTKHPRREYPATDPNNGLPSEDSPL